MKAILLTTSNRQKLQPLSSGLPAALAPIAGRPIMLHNIDVLGRQGIRKILVSLHHQAGAIESYFGTGERWGVGLEYLLQRDNLGTAGALAWAHKYLTETFLVLPADSLIDLDIVQLLEQHKQQHNMVTMVMHVTSPRKWSELSHDAYDQEARANTLFPDGWCSTGVYVMEPRVLEAIPQRTPFDIETQLIPMLLRAGYSIRSHKMHGYWNPLETMEDYQNGQRVFLQSSAANNGKTRSWFQYLQINQRPRLPGVWVGKGSSIHPSTRIVPPVFIGENCRVGREVEIGPNTVLGSDIIVDDEATIEESTVLDHTYIGRLVQVKQRVVHQGLVIDIPSAEKVYITDAFLVHSTHSTIEGSLVQRAFEVLIAFFILLITLPFTLPLSIWIGLTSGRIFERAARLQPVSSRAPAQFQENPGRFVLLHFDKGLWHGQPTWLSRWLEQWELYRLPEIWNVVRGELRLVGVQPRDPEQPVEEAPWNQQALASQPGLTGLWYVQVPPDGPLDEALLADVYYVATRSWQTDLAILRKTPAAWFRRMKARTQKKTIKILENGICS